MKTLADHEVRLWLTGAQWIALRHLADQDDRALSAYIRRVLSEHLDRVSDTLARHDSDSPGLERG